MMIWISKIKHSIFFVFSLLLLFSCTEEKSTKENKNVPLFTLADQSRTGIDFKNNLRETLYMNGLFYEYYYNGGGVSIGDFNNDNLPDIYFISNLESNRLYLNQGKLKFKEVTKQAGVTGGSVFPTGVTTVDINSDGLLDIYICSSGKFEDPKKRRNELYINQGVDQKGIPRFQENAKQYNLDIEEFSTQASFFDYDLDGDLDMFLINHDVEIYGDHQLEKYLNTKGELSGERLYRNDNGKYVDVTDTSGIINNRLGYGLGLAVGDVNKDGWPDVYVSHDFSGEDHLYINNKNGTFLEKGKQAMGHISFFSMGNDIADYNNDGWLDIMSVDMVSEDNYGIKTSMSGMNVERFYKHVDLGLHHQYMFNTLQTNNGMVMGKGPYFSETAQLAGVSNTDWSWAPLFFDMNNDGFQDLFVANGIKRDFRNNDFISYHKKVREKLSKEKTVDKEAYINHVMSKMPTRKKSNYFFLNNADLTFTKVNENLGIDSLLTSSNGASYADFDNDGDLDLVVNNMDDFAHIYENNSNRTNDNNFLKVRLKGPEGNTNGIGVKVKVVLGDTQQIREQNLTRGFQSSVGLVMHFGLGNNMEVERIEIVWPDGKLELLKNIRSNQTLDVNYYSASDTVAIRKAPQPLFMDITEGRLDHTHKENDFNDFERESLLPHKMSHEGPALAIGDVNGDGMDDVFLGGAIGQSPELHIQNKEGLFDKKGISHWKTQKQYEDVAAEFFDADGDGDLDLYVVSGGNEYNLGSPFLHDRLYINNGEGNFSNGNNVLPQLSFSGSCVKVADFDKDGDLDLFVGGRQVPGSYPSPANSYVLQNNTLNGHAKFTDITKSLTDKFENLGMVTDALWKDLDNDGYQDLVVVGEWMPISIFKNNQGNGFVDVTEQYGLKGYNGWWYSIAAGDFDKDGDIDLIAGNLGLNYKHKASFEQPFEIFADDFDNSGTNDIVLSYYNNDKLVPVRGRECSSNQMPFIKEKFLTYDAFGKAAIKDIFDKEQLEKSIHLKANTFATTLFENIEGKFESRILPNVVQTTSVNTIVVNDINGDGNLDLVLAGNLYNSEVETPRSDAGYGLYLEGDGEGNFTPFSPDKSGLMVRGEVKFAKKIKIKKSDAIMFVINNDGTKIITVNK